ncbi:hypothetical protein SH139x_002315 [Planctomycetaceae bacterium SH139]
MTEQPRRPLIVPLTLAQFIDAAPGRVRKRLDKTPDAAQQWEWLASAEGWLINSGEEQVTLKVEQGVLATTSAAACTCLLSPRCFHILACLNTLAPAESQDGQEPQDTAEPQDVIEPNASHPAVSTIGTLESLGQATFIEVAPAMRTAGQTAREELRLLTRSGGRRADLLRQSGLLRAAHSCRAAGLINLGNLLLRVVESVRRQREALDTADTHSLADGIGVGLYHCDQLLRNQHVTSALIGQSRRQFAACDLKKLTGLCAEPVLTLSGYAGVVVHVQGADAGEATKATELFSVNHLRPGDRQWISQAYRGGIDVGSQTLQAAEMCRGQILVQNLTVSQDGRLGKGKNTRWAITKRPLEQAPFSRGLFGTALAAQIQTIFANAALPVNDRIAGWNLIAFTGQVVGAQGSALVVRVGESMAPWKMRIAIDHPHVPFRENLTLLSRCPGLMLRCLGRLRLNAAGEVDLLAIAAGQGEEAGRESMQLTPRPTLKLPDEWKEICNVGCDLLERHHVIGIQRWSEEVHLETKAEHSRGAFEGSPLDGLEPLRRRQIAIALGGRQGVAEVTSETHLRDRSLLLRHHQHTAAELLDLLALTAKERELEMPTRGAGKEKLPQQFEQVYLATHLYLQSAALHFQQQMWLNKIGLDDRH